MNRQEKINDIVDELSMSLAKELSQRNLFDIKEVDALLKIRFRMAMEKIYSTVARNGNDHSKVIGNAFKNHTRYIQLEEYIHMKIPENARELLDDFRKNYMDKDVIIKYR